VTIYQYLFKRYQLFYRVEEDVYLFFTKPVFSSIDALELETYGSI